MITTAGSAAVGRLLADGLAGYIAVGSGTAVPTVDDERLEFEVYRAPIRSRSYDPNTRTIVYTATVPDDVALTVNEVALVGSSYSTLPGGFIANFDSGSEEWDGGNWVEENIRVGDEGLNIAASTASSTGATRVALSSTGKSDSVQVAYFGAGGNVEVRLTNTDTDYFSMTFPAGSGHGVFTIPIHALTVVGEPEIISVNGVTVIHTGAGSVTMDAIKVTPMIADEDIVVRQRFTPGRKKIAGMPMDIEVPLQL